MQRVSKTADLPDDDRPLQNRVRSATRTGLTLKNSNFLEILEITSFCKFQGYVKLGIFQQNQLVELL